LSTGTSEASAHSPLDWLKWLVVIGLLGGGVFGNWYYQAQPLLFRVSGLVVVAVLAALMAVQTEKGRAAWTLIKESRSEIRRVVWPKREEVVQTTMIVLVLVLIFALILWGLDSGLSWLVRLLIG
jgi:preprotein translocase subunit SecE